MSTSAQTQATWVRHDRVLPVAPISVQTYVDPPGAWPTSAGSPPPVKTEGVGSQLTAIERALTSAEAVASVGVVASVVSRPARERRGRRCGRRTRRRRRGRSPPSSDDAPVRAGHGHGALDFRTDDKDAEVARLEAHGARCADIGQGEQSRVVLTDPD